MILYAESSAILVWLLGEPQGLGARQALAEAEVIVTSELTLIECDRVLIRAHVTHQIPEGRAVDLQAPLNRGLAH